MKKCTFCGKPAVYHITEIVSGDVKELHLCRTHFEQYMRDPQELIAQATGQQSAEGTPLLAMLAGALKAARSEADDELTCPECGITFAEFKKQGRLGCPHDYEVFGPQLELLLESMHRSSEHSGKYPRHHGNSLHRRAELLRLRRQLNEAVGHEHYEAAADLRDQIHAMEEELNAEKNVVDD